MTVFAAFLLLSLAWSWACWLPLAFGVDAGSATPWLVQAGSFGPLCAALAALAPRSRRTGRLAFRHVLAQPRRLLSGAGLLAVAVPIAILLAAQRTWLATGGVALPPIDTREFLPLAMAVFAFGVVPEELGWRGYALPAWLQGRDPVGAAFTLGLAWIIWQLPLYFVPGTYQSGIDIGSAAGLLHATNILAESLLLCALYRMTGSIWPVIVYRGMTVLAGELWQLPVSMELHRCLWTIAVAFVVLARPSAFHMTARPSTA